MVNRTTTKGEVDQGGVVYRQKKKGGGGGFSTVRGASQNGDGRNCARPAEPREILCYAVSVFKGVRVAPGAQ